MVSAQNWIELFPTGSPPGVRENHTAVFDQTGNRMMIFGGQNLISTCCPYVIGDYNDVWVLAEANGMGGMPFWTQLSPLGGPPPLRSGHSAVYDPSGNRMIIFRGSQWNQAAQTYSRLGDLWQLDNVNGLGGTPVWTKLPQSGTLSGPRVQHTAAFDMANERMIVLGGRDSTDTPSNRVWILELNPSRVTICHQPGTPAQKTITIPKSALSGHLRHGDTIGSCP